MPLSISYCNCCGLAIEAGGDSDCPRCSYPVNNAKEEAFLRASLHDLERVAHYGGTNITVPQLIHRYQYRLAYLSQQVDTATPSATAVPLSTSPVVQRTSGEVGEPQPAQDAGGSVDVVVNKHESAVQPASRQMFSIRTFFADQTINIVASLGAFLILIGSLSFIATTTNLLLALIILLAVHAIFGSTGAISYRFASLRTVSVIYTAIFALQVPLVGFSAYRFLVGSTLHISDTLLIALAAGYAAGTYSVLAIYQSFKPFAYLAAIALLVTDLAIAATLHLALCWWPAMLMLSALPLLVFVYQAAPLAEAIDATRTRARNVLREPALVLMGICVACCALGALLTTLVSLSLPPNEGMQAELRFSTVTMTLLLIGWFSIFIWRTKLYERMKFMPYLCLTCLLAILYAFYAPRPAYVLALTMLAFLTCGLARLDLPFLRGQGGRVAEYWETLGLLIVAAMPFIAAPDLVLDLWGQAYLSHPGSTLYPASALRAPFETVLYVIALVAGCALIISVMLRHTGRRKTLTTGQAQWCWLLLLCGLIASYAYAIVVVALNLLPVWAMLGFFLLCLVLAVWARRFLGAAWALPLDALSICVFIEVLLLGLEIDPSKSSVLLLTLAALFYALALYQRRRAVFLLFFTCALIALFDLCSSALPALLVLVLLLPLGSIAVHRALIYRQRVANPTMTERQLEQRTFEWEWPLLLVSVLYSVCFALHDSISVASTLQHWLALPFSAAVELALLAVVWYAAGLLAQNKSWVGLAVGFALWGIVLVPQTIACQLQIDNASMDSLTCLRRGQLALYWLTGIAIVGVVAALCADWLLQRAKGMKAAPAGLYEQLKWSWPFYTVSLGAVAMLLLWSRSGVVVIPREAMLTALCELVIVSLAVMLVKRIPELLILVAILAGSLIASTPSFWQQMVASSLLCILIFAAQFTWRLLTPTFRLVAPASLSAVLGIGGQGLVVLIILLRGGLFATAGVLAHPGAGSLVVLALLMLWWGYIQTAYAARWSLVYTAGLLCSLALSWELSAFALTQLSTLWLAPACYLLVIAPFLSRDEKLSWHHSAGQLCSIAGSILLLLPALWLSFSENNLQPSLLLAGEALLLLLLGLTTRVRIFVLSSISLIIITAIHVLFLPSLGIPTFLALSLMGLFLLAVATGLVLVRSRLATLWTQLE